jgi:hypothetical protein
MVLSSLKRSMIGPTRAYPVGPPFSQRELPLDAQCERADNPASALLALAPPQDQSAEILENPQSRATDTSRTGKNRKKVRRQSPAKGAQGKICSSAPRLVAQKTQKPAMKIN